ncbi:G-protein coupled receptor GRL101-like [Ruditapes philippinarum]|uniref:G-protein coupled receptor GRL101-like n=1 Tax=Ruditapes philippinarum TaxID=129788 RepID=UPI00295C06CA|nr:G-protein coupled receptor GRL101-like [Ruditapes philippinarum]
MAKHLLESVHFTNDHLKGVILIQTRGVAEEVNKEIVKTKFILEQNAKVYRVIENFNVSSYSKTSSSENVLEFYVRRWQSLNGIGAEYFSDLCNITTKVHCPYGYKCAWSHACLLIDQVCDGIIHCIHGDDEAICDFRCPDNCTCQGYVADCSNTDFQLSLLPTIPDTVRYLDLSSNIGLSSILEETYLHWQTLIVFNLSYCGIQRINSYSFERIKNIRHLDLSYNLLTILPDFVFISLEQLQVLNLRGNYQLSVIGMEAFAGLDHVGELDLANARLETILADTFSGMSLHNLDLSNNKLKGLASFAFRGASIRSISFKENNIKSFNTEIFTGLIGLENLITPEFKFCCIRPNYVKEENCYPQKDEFSSCDDLMRNSVLQFLIWLIGITAFLGNILTLLYRLKYDRDRLKLGFGIFVTNLAVADFLMAIYLIIIAAADSAFRKRYIFMDDYWRHSIWCNLAGMLSTTSSEASVLFLCLITLDRLLVIKFPFGRAKLTKDRAVTCAIFTWVFSVTAAIFPLAYEGYFKNEFYSKSGVCIALPLTRDRPPGWVYSLSVFVCLNFLTFILVAVGQLSIFIEIRNYSGIATTVESSRKRDLKVARNLLLVVATDFMCWFPIGVMAMFALSGHVISGEVYAWAAVFILPVNSALNPILYTLSAIVGGTKFSPSTDEQSLKQMTKELGENAIRCLNASRCLTRSIRRHDYEDITLIPDEVDIPAVSILSICKALAHTLEGLQSCSLDISLLDKGSLFVGVRSKQLTGLLRIKAVPFISYKPEDKTERIKHLGMIMKGLLAAREKRQFCGT